MFNVKLIEKYIKQNSITKKEFAQLCGISTMTLVRILTGKPIRKSLSTLMSIASVLGCSSDDLLKLNEYKDF